MHKTLFVLCLLLAAAPIPASAAGEAELLREHRIRDLAGSETSLSEFEGQVVVVNFWASWCKPCRKELAVFDQWSNEMPDVAFAAISIDQDQRKAQRFRDLQKLSLPIYHDGPEGLARQLDLPYLPCTYVLNAKGEVALVTPGATEEKLAELRSALEGLRRAPAQASMQGGRP